MLAIAVLTALPSRAGDLQLLMIDQAHCVWCAAWDRDVGPIYPKTEAGRRAPLVRVDLRAPLPDGVSLDRPARFTPTFILLENGAEIGRIDGYPGEDFFWAILEKMLAQRDASRR